MCHILTGILTPSVLWIHFPLQISINSTHHFYCKSGDQWHDQTAHSSTATEYSSPKLHIISQQHGQRQQDKPEAWILAPLIPFSHVSDALKGARQMINAPRSCCTSTQVLIKLRWSVRGQVRAILHPSSEFQQASPRLAERSPKSAVIDTFWQSLLAQPSTTTHLPKGSLCSGT